MRKSLLRLLVPALFSGLVLFGPGVSQEEEDESLYVPKGSEESDEAELLDIMGTLAESPDLSVLSTLLKEAQLADLLTGEGPLTLFAPTDSAFAQLPDDVLESIMSDRQRLQALLSRHIVPDTMLLFYDIGTLTVLTWSDDEIAITVGEEDVIVEQANVIEEEVWCANGVIHVIDAVLLPPESTGKQDEKQ